MKHNELAQHFGCAPSQINYVLATRFPSTMDVIESGAAADNVRIIRIQRANDESSLSVLLRRIGRSIDEIRPMRSFRGCWATRLLRAMALTMPCGHRAKRAGCCLLSTGVLRAAVFRNGFAGVYRSHQKGNDGNDVR